MDSLTKRADTDFGEGTSKIIIISKLPFLYFLSLCSGLYITSGAIIFHFFLFFFELKKLQVGKQKRQIFLQETFRSRPYPSLSVFLS